MPDSVEPADLLLDRDLEEIARFEAEEEAEQAEQWEHTRRELKVRRPPVRETVTNCVPNERTTTPAPNVPAREYDAGGDLRGLSPEEIRAKLRHEDVASTYRARVTGWVRDQVDTLDDDDAYAVTAKSIGAPSRGYWRDKAKQAHSRHVSPAQARAQWIDAEVWVRQNDPRRTAEGVTAEVAETLAGAGLHLAAVRLEAFKPGRPTGERRKLRVKVRDALTPMYEDDRRRDLMADALGVSRQKLHALMTK